MGDDAALAAFGRYLHQDIALNASTPADLAKAVLALMQPQERTALRAYLSTALDRRSPSELKGDLNRANENWGFSSKGTVELLRAVAAELEAER